MREQAVCFAVGVIFLMLLYLRSKDGFSLIIPIAGAFSAIFRLAYLQVQKKKLIARGPAKSRQDWWDEWDERKQL
jgi:hypothetical protein